VSEKILNIEAFNVVVPLPQPLSLGSLRIPDREYVLVRIRDKEGHCGTAVGLTRNGPIAGTVLRTIIPHLIGRPFEDYDDLYEIVIQANTPLGTNGIFWRALSLVDCAMHDLLAQRAGKPLYSFLEGERRDIPCLLVGGYPVPSETMRSLQDQAEKMLVLNAAVIKIGSCGDMVRDTQRLKAIREAVPNGPPLAIDLYWQFRSPKKLVHEAKRWETLRMAWVEDPFAFDDYESAAALSSSLSYPVAIGDEQAGHRNFQRLMDQGKIGVVRLDATVCGGVKAFLRIAKEANERNLPVVCHLFHHLHLQLACVAPAVKYVEQFLPGLGLDSLDLLWKSDIPLRNGKLTAGNLNSGIWDWNEEKINLFRK
jgi:L-alanine-DL-glutamate epimerase-like enolase superfamily enzyme